MRAVLKAVTTLSVSVVFAAGCATPNGGAQQAQAQTQSAATAGGGTSASGQLTDPQIAAVVVAANTVDIKAGELALSRSQHPEVKKFAQQMVTDHTGVNQAATELVTKLNVTPEENEVSRGLMQSGEQTRQRLSGLSGSEFDQAYVDNEVSYHETVLQALDNTLIPSAKNAELKNMLVSVRPAFVAHLEHARSIQASLRGGAGSGESSSTHH